MEPDGFVKATVKLAHDVDLGGPSKLSSSESSFYAQLEGEWVHLVRDSDAQRGEVTVFTVPQSAIKSITWTRFFNS